MSQPSNNTSDVVASQLTHYQILQLSPRSDLSNQEIKSAYHKALLRHHPDKEPLSAKNTQNSPIDVDNEAHLPASTETGTNNVTISIDRLTQAYKTLSSPLLKREYDKLLLTTHTTSNDASSALSKAHHHPGVEVVDLEDMTHHFDDEREIDVWRRGCRCGGNGGYEVTEWDLEREEDEACKRGGKGERDVYVGCKGCSLFVRVVFGVVDEDEEEEEEAG